MKKKPAKKPAKKATTKKAAAKPAKKATTAKKAAKPAGKPAVASVEPAKKAKKAEGKKAKVETDPGKARLNELARKTLVGMGRDLGLEMSATITDDDLRKLVADAMIGMTPEVEKVLADIDLAQTKDCIGLFLDLSNYTCISCTLRQSQCAKAFEQYSKTGWKAFDKIRLSAQADAAAAEVKAEDLPTPTPKAKKADKPAKVKKATKKAPSAFDATRKIQCYGMTDEEIEESMEGETLQGVVHTIMDKVPENMGELRDLLLDVYEPDTDDDKGHAKLVKNFLDIFIDLGLIELV